MTAKSVLRIFGQDSFASAINICNTTISQTQLYSLGSDHKHLLTNLEHEAFVQVTKSGTWPAMT